MAVMGPNFWFLLLSNLGSYCIMQFICSVLTHLYSAASLGRRLSSCWSLGGLRTWQRCRRGKPCCNWTRQPCTNLGASYCHKSIFFLPVFPARRKRGTPRRRNNCHTWVREVETAVPVGYSDIGHGDKVSSLLLTLTIIWISYQTSLFRM